MPKSDESGAAFRPPPSTSSAATASPERRCGRSPPKPARRWGAAHCYFDSKDAIVLAFYDQAQTEFEPLLGQALAGSRDLARRQG